MEYIIKRLSVDGKDLVFGKTNSIKVAYDILGALSNAYKDDIFFFQHRRSPKRRTKSRNT